MAAHFKLVAAVDVLFPVHVPSMSIVAQGQLQKLPASVVLWVLAEFLRMSLTSLLNIPGSVVNLVLNVQLKGA